VQVTYFHRKPRPNANFSIESVFESVRRELTGRINARVCVAPFCSNGLLRRLLIGWHARRNQGELNHVTGDTNFTALALDGKRTILTNHDCGYVARTTGLRRWVLLRLWLKFPVKHVAAVTTVSDQIKEEIIRYAGCPPEKIHVIPNAVPHAFKPVFKPFNAECPRILHVGTAPNKNLPRLIDAVAGLGCTLVIVGKINDDVRHQLKEACVEYENHVNLSELEMVRQYEQCDLAAFASTYEGFGMPILEAQAAGRPVLTSDRRPMSAVAGEGACLVDPMNAKSIRAGIDRLVSDADFRNHLIERGFQNIQRFQPERIAQQYLALYEKVLAEANLPCSRGEN
jgi:glycosyltransferase involved in cell wall biosynthesis